MTRSTSLVLAIVTVVTLTMSGANRKAGAVPVPQEDCVNCTTCFFWSMFQRSVGEDVWYQRFVRYQGNQPIVETNAFKPAAVQYWIKPPTTTCYATGMNPEAVELPDFGTCYIQTWTTGTKRCVYEHYGQPVELNSVGGTKTEESEVLWYDCKYPTP